MMFSALLTGIFFCLLMTPAVAADPSMLTVSADQQLGFADTLFDQAAYDAAITEYRRLVYLFPDAPLGDYACFKVALAYFMRHDFEKALSLFEKLYSKGVKNKYAVESCFMISRCCQALGKQDPAVKVLKELMAAMDDIDVRDKAHYLIGWIYLESGPALGMGDISRAEESFAQMSGKSQGAYKVVALIKRLQEAATDRKGLLASQKNPHLAGVLAVFPGAGYVYCGRYHDALMAFLFNTGMGLAAYEAFDNDLEALSALIGVAGVGFYAGSIYGSVSAAYKYNRTLSRKFLKRLDDTRIYFTPLSGGDGAKVSFHVPF